MNKHFVLILLGFIAFNSTAFAGDPDFIIEEPILQFEPVQFEQFEINPVPLEMIPFNPDDPYIDDPSINVFLDVELIEGGRISLRWNRYDGNNFLYYKIMHSQDKENMVYPIDPYLDFYEDQNKTGYIHQEAPVGDNLYRICVITTDDKRGCSNTRFIFKDESLMANENQQENIQPIDEPKPELTDAQKNALKNNKGSNFIKWVADNSGVILTLLALIVAISGFTFATSRKRKSISKYMNQIDDTYSEYKMKAKRCEAELYRLKDIVDSELKNGKIDESAYQLLINRIEGYMVDIQKQIVNEKFGGLPASLKEEMFKMLEDGEISENEFETLQKLIKRSELSVNEQDSLIQQIKDFKKQDDILKKRTKN